ncbi:MAG: DUF4097 domain-containing protein [Chloroflexi bacterium]|nr:DUF4097 domain-containing protein [Chloroflexota bacterium]
MNRLSALILILFVWFIPACMPAPAQYTELESGLLGVEDSQSILIQVDHGEVIVLGTEEQQAQVKGQVLFVDELEYQVRSTEEQISIKAFTHRKGFSDIPLRLEVRVPKQRQVKIETDSASVSVQDYEGVLEVDSTSGIITIEQLAGKITLYSNRGNITVRESSGNISIVGNYGALNVQNVYGETAVSTIMGNVVFNGLIQTGDIVRLETDHGSVSVNLSLDSALSLQVRSTSGDVACVLPDINSSTRTCDGEIRSGGGILSIRTVSGAVTLQMIP